MPRWPPLHPRYAAELRRLARRDVGYAEAHRLLIPLASDLGLPRPTYWTVRRFLIAQHAELNQRRRDRERFEEQVVVPLLSGGIPRMD